LRIFRGDHDFEAFSAFVSSAYWMFALRQPKGASASRKARSELRFRNCLHQRRKPWQRTAWRRRGSGGGQDYKHPTKVVTRGSYCVGRERQSPCLDQTLQEATCSPLSWAFRPDREWPSQRRLLGSFRIRGHRSEIMFGVLVIVLCSDCVADLGFSAGERQIPFVVSSRVLRAYRLGASGARCPPLRAGTK
jgi:hypothetical protein